MLTTFLLFDGVRIKWPQLNFILPKIVYKILSEAKVVKHDYLLYSDLKYEIALCA